MSSPSRSRWPWHRRRQYVIDAPTQTAVVVRLVAVLVGIGVLYAVAVYVLLTADLMNAMRADETRRFLVVVHTAYFALGASILTVSVLLLTHRFVGPAYVMRQALEGMRKGDSTRRLTLRKTDYLKSLAAELSAFRAEWVAREGAREADLERLDECLRAGDHEAALGVLEALRAKRPDAGSVAREDVARDLVSSGA
jgi:hypothetical protein